RARARAAGMGNVAFLEGDLRGEIGVAGDFDALVGRFVLMYLGDPAAALRRLVRHLRPGGVVAFQEADIAAGVRASPPSPLLQRVHGWLARSQEMAGAELAMGLKAYRAFLDAGLPAPQMRAHALMGAGPDWEGYEWVAATVRGRLPKLLAWGIAT